MDEIIIDIVEDENKVVKNVRKFQSYDVDGTKKNNILQKLYEKNNTNISVQEPWTDKREALILSWRTSIQEMSTLHEQYGSLCKRKNKCLSIPTFILPLIMSFVQLIFENLSVPSTCILQNNTCTLDIQQDDNNISSIASYVNGAFWLIDGIFSIIYTTYDLGNLSALHFQYSARYYDLIFRIDFELSKTRNFRRDADSFITEMRCTIDNLNSTGPDFS